MDINERLRIERIQSPDGATSKSDKAVDPAEFARLLDQLKKSAKSKNKGTGPGDGTGPGNGTGDDVDKLNEAVKRADDDYETAMNLRKLLEDAYRKRQG